MPLKGSGREYDCVIVGAGPAGLSAALVLGRACRRILLCDSGTPRSWASKEMHSFLTREGVSPKAFRRMAHRELKALRNVEFVASAATRIARVDAARFKVTLASRRRVTCRKLLIATGVFDEIPTLPGIDALFGRSVFQCPYCDGWEMRGKAIAVYGKGQRGFEMARAMTAWSRDIVLCTDGRAGLNATSRDHLARNGIEVIEERISRLIGAGGQLKTVEFASGRKLARTTLFFDTPCASQSRLAESLGCQFTRRGGIKCGQYEATSVPGVFVAGNIIKDVQLSVVAAAEGARAAFGINRALTREDFARNATGTQRVEHPPLEGATPVRG